MAREVEALSEGRLRVRSLREPEVQTLLDRVRPGWRWEPMLLEAEGERVRVYTGLAIRMRLVRILGPARALRVAQLVARFGGPVLGVDWGRRRLLQQGGALAGLALLGEWIHLLRGPASSAAPSVPTSRMEGELWEGFLLLLAVYDRGRGQWEWIPAAGAREGFFDLALSADGRWVVWASSAACPPGPGVYLYDRQTRELRPVHPARGRTAVTGGAQVALSADGRWLAFAAPDDGIVPEDRNGVFDVFLYDRETQRVEWLSRPLDPRDPPLPSGVHPVPNTDGAWEGGLTISADGRYVAFASAARLVEGAFAPCAPWPWSDPLPFCRHIYLYDRATGQRTLVDRNERGEAGDGAAEGPGISGDGRYVVYATRAKNLGGLEIGPCPPRAAWGRPCDLRLAVWDRERGRTVVLSRGWDGRTVEGPSYDPVLLADGRWLAWTSEAIGWTQQVVPVSGNRPAPYLYPAELEALLQIQK